MPFQRHHSSLAWVVDWHERRTKLTRITSTNRAVRLHRLVNVSAMPINHLAPVSIRRATPYRHQSSRATRQFFISNLHLRFILHFSLNYFTNFFYFFLFFPFFSLSFFFFPILSIEFFLFQIISHNFFQFFSHPLSRRPNDLSFDNPISTWTFSIFLNYLTIPFLHSLSIRNDIFVIFRFNEKEESPPAP